MRSSPSSWRLAPDRHVAVCGDDLVLLDVAAGRYACIPGGGGLIQDVGEHFALEISDLIFAEGLAEAGWIAPGFAAQPRPVLRRPAQSLSIEAGHASGQDIRRMGQALIDVAAHYHGRSFAHLIATARRRRPVQDAADGQALAHQVGVFRALLPWAPFQGVCLYRSFLLLNLLRHAGLDAVWAFGVRTWPFEAHCWLQAGDLVLDDHLDHVAGYTPILVV